MNCATGGGAAGTATLGLGACVATPGGGGVAGVNGAPGCGNVVVGRFRLGSWGFIAGCGIPGRGAGAALPIVEANALSGRIPPSEVIPVPPAP